MRRNCPILAAYNEFTFDEIMTQHDFPGMTQQYTWAVHLLKICYYAWQKLEYALTLELYLHFNDNTVMNNNSF